MNSRRCRYAVIPHSLAGIFKGQCVKGICTVISCVIDISRKAHIGIALQIFHITACFFAVPEMLQNAVFIGFHLIFRVVGYKLKKSCFFINDNCHSLSLYLKFVGGKICGKRNFIRTVLSNDNKPVVVRIYFNISVKRECMVSVSQFHKLFQLLHNRS